MTAYTRTSDAASPPNRGTDFIVELGSALIAAGAPVGLVEDILEEVSSHNGVLVGYSVLPTGVTALGHDGRSMVASMAATHPATLRFDQIIELFRLVDRARVGEVAPTDGLRQLRDISQLKRHFGRVATATGHVLLTTGLALLLEPSLESLGVAAGLGLMVGVIKLVSERSPTLTKLLPGVAAFFVALCVFQLRRSGVGIDGLQTMIPPLVTFLPGAMLTVGAIELTDGSIVTGTSRLVAGVFQLLIIVFGTLGAATLVKLPASVGLVGVATPRVGEWGPWVGVALFGLGSAMFFSAPPRAFPPLLAVLYAAYLTQVATDRLASVYLSGFTGAIVAILAASAARRHFDGPPVLVTFLPAFWLLVPGVLSLVGATRLAVGDTATEDVVTASFTILAVALGVVVGLGTDRSLTARISWW